jgi:choline-glycine betaine transporter
VTSIIPNSFRTGAFGDREWLGTWTIFYWAWWISWAPFVGTFIARISRGRMRALRDDQAVLDVVHVPAATELVPISTP